MHHRCFSFLSQKNGEEVFLGNILEFHNTLISPRTMQHTSNIIHHEFGYPDFTFHSFRHTHATMLAEAGAPIKYTQERLGHKDVTVTMQIYQHASDAIRKSGAATLEKMFGKAE